MSFLFQLLLYNFEVLCLFLAFSNFIVIYNEFKTRSPWKEVIESKIYDDQIFLLKAVCSHGI